MLFIYCVWIQLFAPTQILCGSGPNHTCDFYTILLLVESLLIFFLMQFALPHIMGWDRLTNQQMQSNGTVGFQSKTNPQILDLEWDKWITVGKH